jgi:hypothetical protein
MRIRRTVLALTLLVASGWMWAADVCYSEERLPSVVWIDTIGKDIRFWLAGMYQTREWNAGHLLIKKNGGSWVNARANTSLDEARKPTSCEGKIPPAPRAAEEESLESARETYDIGVRNEGPWGCAQVDRTIWFGLSYYHGEGYYGVGGIGRFDLSTKRREVRRPNLLRKSVVPSVAWDGKNLWICAHDPSSGCTGIMPSVGLVKYDWAREETTVFRDTEEGPCGFVPHAVLWRDEQLWVGTDLGLDRFDSKENRWGHYVPSGDGKVVRETTCLAHYRDLLERLQRETDQKVPESFQGLYQLKKALLKFHPETAKKLLVVDPDAVARPPK